MVTEEEAKELERFVDGGHSREPLLFMGSNPAIFNSGGGRQDYDSDLQLALQLSLMDAQSNDVPLETSTSFLFLIPQKSDPKVGVESDNESDSDDTPPPVSPKTNEGDTPFQGEMDDDLAMAIALSLAYIFPVLHANQTNTFSSQKEESQRNEKQQQSDSEENPKSDAVGQDLNDLVELEIEGPIETDTVDVTDSKKSTKKKKKKKSKKSQK